MNFSNDEIIKKATKKKKASYTIEGTILKDFNTICNAREYKKSQIVENLIKVFINQSDTESTKLFKNNSSSIT